MSVRMGLEILEKSFGIWKGTFSYLLYFRWTIIRYSYYDFFKPLVLESFNMSDSKKKSQIQPLPKILLLQRI